MYMYFENLCVVLPALNLWE